MTIDYANQQRNNLKRTDRIKPNLWHDPLSLQTRFKEGVEGHLTVIIHMTRLMDKDLQSNLASRTYMWGLGGGAQILLFASINADIVIKAYYVQKGRCKPFNHNCVFFFINILACTIWPVSLPNNNYMIIKAH